MRYKINFHIFENCNMRCKFCFRNKAENNRFKPLDDYKKIISRLKEIEMFDYVNFAGGEPTLYPPPFSRFNTIYKR